MKKRISSILLVLIMIIVQMPTTVFAASYTVYESMNKSSVSGTATPGGNGTDAVSYTYSDFSLAGETDSWFNVYNSSSETMYDKAENINFLAEFATIEDISNYGSVTFNATTAPYITYTPSADVAGKTVTFTVIASYEGSNSTKPFDVETSAIFTIDVGAVPTAGSDNANLSALTYSIEGNEQAVDVPGFDSETTVYKVWLPYGTDIDKEITLQGTLADSKASETNKTSVKTSYMESESAASIKVLAENGATTKTYNVKFEVENPVIKPFVKIGDTLYESAPTSAINLDKGSTVEVQICHGYGKESEGNAYSASYKTNVNNGVSFFKDYEDALYYDVYEIDEEDTSLTVKFYDVEQSQIGNNEPVDTWNIALNWMDEVTTPDMFEVSSDGSTIVGFNKAYLESLSDDQKGNLAIVIPAEINGVAITAIGERAFYKCEDIASVDFSEAINLRTIGTDSFRFSTIAGELILPDSLESAGEMAFRSCKSLTSVQLGSGLKAISNHMFNYCSGIETIAFDENNQVTKIGNDAFQYCSSLKGIALPEEINAIENEAFRNCQELDWIYFENVNFTALQIDNNTSNETVINLIHVDEHPGLHIIAKDAEAAETLKSGPSRIECDPSYFAYPITIKFDGLDASNNREVLYNFPLNYQKVDGDDYDTWEADDTYELPTAEAGAWSFDEEATDDFASVTSKVIGDTLYQVKKEPTLVIETKGATGKSGNTDLIQADYTPGGTRYELIPSLSDGTELVEYGEVGYCVVYEWAQVCRDSDYNWIDIDLYGGDVPTNYYDFVDVDDWSVEGYGPGGYSYVTAVLCYCDGETLTEISSSKHFFKATISPVELTITTATTGYIGDDLTSIVTMPEGAEGTLNFYNKSDGFNVTTTIADGVNDYGWYFKTSNSNYEDTYQGAFTVTGIEKPNGITGKVMAEDGTTPVEGATVKITVNDTVKTVITDANGNYIITDVPEGIYTVTVTTGEGDNVKTQTSTVTVDADKVDDILFVTEGTAETDVVVEAAQGLPPIMADNLETMFLPDDTTRADKVKITLKVDKQDSEEEKNLVDAFVFGQNVVGEYFDITLNKETTIQGSTTNELIQPPTGKKVKISIEVPAQYRDKAPYQIVRVHDGRVEIIPSEYNQAFHILSFDADKFSTYAYTYTDSNIVVHTLTIDGVGTGGAVDGTYANSNVVNINAGIKSGYTFKNWTTNNGGTFANENSTITTFTMPDGDVTITANWTKNSTGGSGSSGSSSSTDGSSSSTVGSSTSVTTADSKHTVDVNFGVGDGQYEAGAWVTITAEERPGKTFSHWVSDEVTFENKNASTTRFIMNGNNVRITAVYTGGHVNPQTGFGFSSRKLDD